jgi:SAM-dependent methyltransferase
MIAGWNALELDHYRRVGEDARALIFKSLQLAKIQPTEVKRVLDLPCGYGRVLRHLLVALPASSITAADIDRRAVAFCNRHFGALELLSHQDFLAIKFPHLYNLIWVGSLLTHLPAGDATKLVEVLIKTLSPGGLLIFTTLAILDDTQWSTMPTITRQRRNTIEQALRTVGEIYLAYDEMSFQTPAWIEDLMSNWPTMTLVRHSARAWDGRQDVWAYRRGMSDTSAQIWPGPHA